MWNSGSRTRLVLLLGLTLMVVALPASARRRGSDSKAAADTTKAKPAAAAQPAGSAPAAEAAPAAPAAPTAAAPAAAAAAAAPRMPALSDSARAALKAEVGHQLKQLADTLNLSQEQRDKARPILLDHAYQLRQIRMKYAAVDRTPANRAALQKDVANLRDATDAKLAGVFTPEQMAAYKSWREQSMTRAKSRMGVADSTAAGHK